MKRFNLLIYFLSAILLSGCVKGLLTSKSSIRDFYTLSAIERSHGAQPLAVALIVQRPTMGPGLGGEKIALLTEPYKMDYYADARWIAELPRIIQARIIESFENTGMLPKVSNTSSDMQADYLLALEVRAFQAEYPQPDVAPQIHVKIVFKLLTAREHRVVKTGQFETRIAAPENSLDDVMSTFDRAFQVVEGEIIRAVLQKLRGRGN